MKTLSSELLLEQKKPTRQPAIEASIREQAHLVQYSASAYHFGFFGWQKLWEGSTPDPTNHGAAIPSDGSLNRIGVNDSLYIYHQRVTTPGPLSDFGAAWTYLGDTVGDKRNAAIAGTLSSQNMYIFYRYDDEYKRLKYSKSTDGGASWGSPGTAVSTAYSPILIAACMGAADTAGVLYIYLNESSQQVLTFLTGSSAGWSTPAYKIIDVTVLQASVCYDGDYNIVLLLSTGKLCRVVYGNGYRQAAGTWSEIEYLGLSGASAESVEIVTQYQQSPAPQNLAPDYSNFSYGSEPMSGGQQVTSKSPARSQKYYKPNRSLTPTEEYPWGIDHTIFPITQGWNPVSTVSKVTTIENIDINSVHICKPPGQPPVMAFTRPGERWFYRLKPGTDFYDGKWERAHRQLIDTPYGMAVSCDGTYLWATRTNEVWRCVYPGVMPSPPFSEAVTPHPFAVSRSEIISVKETVRTMSRSELVLEVDNSTGKYSVLPVLAVERGSRVDIRYGYFTGTMNELTGGSSYFLESWAYKRKPTDRRYYSTALMPGDCWKSSHSPAPWRSTWHPMSILSMI